MTSFQKIGLATLSSVFLLGIFNPGLQAQGIEDLMAPEDTRKLAPTENPPRAPETPDSGALNEETIKSPGPGELRPAPSAPPAAQPEDTGTGDQERGFFNWPPLPDESSQEEEKGFSESTFVEEAPPPVHPPEEKKMVETPQTLEKHYLDAGDFRDPFFPVRGFQEDSAEVLEPGITIDGIRFNSYSDSGKFIENYYRDSNFSINDVFGKVVQLKRGDGCLSCHQGIEQISKNHNFRCSKCHGGNRRARSLPQAHKGLVSNPSDLKHAPKFCGKCHADQIEKVRASLMTTAKGIINITRYAWGAQPRDTDIYSLLPEKGTNEKLPPTPEKGHPVDSFLRTKCLRCHIQGNPPHRAGDFRATGCAACHMIYANDGSTLTRDRAIQSKQRAAAEIHRKIFQRKSASLSLENPRGYPVLHKFTLAIPSVQCEHCHNANGVGNEFEGLLSKPARPKSSQQRIDDEKPVLYGSEHEFLVPDIHRERGMHCIDCHVGTDIKGASAPSPMERKIDIKCEDCHGTPFRTPEEFLLLESDPNSKAIIQAIRRNHNLVKKIGFGDSVLVNSQGTRMHHIKRVKDKWILYSKVTGAKHIIPILKDIKPPPAHQIEGHMTLLECYTCHARWSAADWGMHLIYEKEPDLGKWRDWSFSDPSLQHLISQQNPDNGSKTMLDWVTAVEGPGGIEGNYIKGVWWDVLTETSWDSLILGKNPWGKYTVMKPRYQYFVTGRPGKGPPPLKRAELLQTRGGNPGLILQPHAPHTIRKTARSCESCHRNPLTAGLGDPLKNSIKDAKTFFDELKSQNHIPSEFQLKQVVTSRGQPLQTAFPPRKARFLNLKEIAALKKKTDSYRAFRYLDLREKRLPRLLIRGEFPYDRKHEEKEKRFGRPSTLEDLYYDLDRNEFFSGRISVEDLPASSPDQPEDPNAPQKENPILDFFQDMFQGEPSPNGMPALEKPVEQE
ncbi:MAG: hypothetical protein ACE5E9_09325 [Nitrospinaceae bacterium]